jgi:hypothetical protein
MSTVLEDRSQTHETPTEKRAQARNQVVWFDMPVIDLDRSIRFYSAVLEAPFLI